MAESYGVSTIGTLESTDFVASLRQPRQIYGVFKKVEDGDIYARGTVWSKDTDDTYIKHDGTKAIAGVSNEIINTIGGNVKSYLFFDFDADATAVISDGTIEVGFDAGSLINFVEVK
jgi:hypothetical protein